MARTALRYTILVACMVQALLLVWVAGRYLVLVGLRHPMLDQFRLYPLYLDLAFPQNLFQIENGHRPVLPAMVRVFEIWATHADQTIQLAVGALAALAVALAGAIVHRRFDRADAAATAMAALAGCMAVFWMANARMLMHGNESVHAFFAAGFALLAFLGAWRSSRRNCPKCFAMSIGFAIAAGLSFGPGLAAFGLVLIGAFLAGNRRFLQAGLVTSVGFGVTYLFLMPQGDNAQAVIHLNPIPLIEHLLAWLGAALAYAGLGANPDLLIVHAPALAKSPLAALSGDGVVWWVLRGSAFAVIVMTLVSSWRSWRAPDQTSKLTLTGIGLSWFAIGAALLVCLARSDYFADHPEQRFADRYLIWSCLFFLGAWFQIQGQWRRSESSLVAGMVLLFAVLMVQKPADRTLQGWAISFHHMNERNAAAMLFDVNFPELYATDPAAPEADRRRTVALFRERQLGVFHGPDDERIRTFEPGVVPGGLDRQTLIVTQAFVDPVHGPTEVLLGQFPIDTQLPATLLLTTDSQGACGILRRVVMPMKSREIRAFSGGIHPGVTGFSTCTPDTPVVLWSLDAAVAQPIRRIEFLRPPT